MTETFLAKVEEIRKSKPTYRQPGYGADGTCDCIGLIIGAIRRMGLKWTGIHGSNWAARREMISLNSIRSADDLQPSDIVYKARTKGEAKYDLPARYQSGGRYYNGDLKDYYHVGVVTGTNPLRITHMTSPTAKIDTTLGKWAYYGRLKLLAEKATSVKTIPADTPHDGSAAVVIAESGKTVNLRYGPSTGKSILCRVPIGETVTILTPGESWAIISYKGNTGYMMAKYLDIVGDGKGIY